MTRRTTLASLSAALVLGAFCAPALADVVEVDGTRATTVCLRTDNGEEGTRKGVCVWVPVDR